MACVENTWFNREMPVLDAVVTQLDQPGSTMAQVRDIAAKTGMDPQDVVGALGTLDGSYVEFETSAAERLAIRVPRGGRCGRWCRGLPGSRPRLCPLRR
jgi:hypothetical protein